MRVPARPLMLSFVALACAFYLPKLFVPDASLFTQLLTPERHAAVGSVAKLACLALGAIGGIWCARRFERHNPSRLPWTLLALWLAAFTIGQCILMVYQIGLRVAAPLPSLADIGFLVGYVLMLAAAARFALVYRASGFPIGSGRAHALLAGGALVVLAVIGYVVLAPIARADAPPAERIINLAYPALDFAALVPTLLLTRIALAFRPGKIWTVWAALLAGFVFMAFGDILFAYLSTAEKKSVEPLVDLTLLLGYFFVAYGTKLQHDLVTD